MNKAELIELKREAGAITNLVAQAISDLTKDNPLILFEKVIDSDNEPKEGEIHEDELYDLPYSYLVDRCSTYEEGAVQKVEGTEVTLYMRGDNLGDTYIVDLIDLPFRSQIELLDAIIERMSNETNN